MSSFIVQAYPLTITAHPNADLLELAGVGGYLSVVRKDEFTDGDLGIYIPEAAIVPDEVLRTLGLYDEDTGKGRLAGSDGRHVKAIRLRGALSQGLVLRPEPGGPFADLLPLAEGIDYAEALGITKYVPEIPAELLGQVEHVPGLRTFTDMENIKRFPDVLADDEPVIMTEKVHGICTVGCYRPGDDLFAVSSKGCAHKGLAMIESDNPYWQMMRRHDVQAVLRQLAPQLGAREEITLFGETLGVQDLRYGLTNGERAYRAFDLRVDGEYLPYDRFLALMAEHDIPTVPVLYEGPFTAEALTEHTNGKSTFDGARHIREGVVIRPAAERRDDTVGRVLLKSISEKYLTRKGDTTEYE